MAETLSDEHVLLLEKTLQKNNEMIAENQKLREEMKAKEENHNKVLREVLTSLRSRLERNRNGSKKANTILFSISRHFWPFYDNAGLFHKISEGNWRFPKANEEVRPLPKMSEEPFKHLTVFSSETVNIKKLANLTANMKIMGKYH